MSEENVERVYMAIDAINRRDLDALLALTDEQVESVSRIVAIEGGLHGHEGVRKWWESWFQAFPDLIGEVVEVRDLGSLLLTTVRLIGHGRASDLPVQDEVFHLVGGGTASASAGRSSAVKPRPSKPPGCRSRPSITPDSFGGRRRATGGFQRRDIGVTTLPHKARPE